MKIRVSWDTLITAVIVSVVAGLILDKLRGRKME